MMVVGRHGALFSYVLQFKKWYDLFLGEVEEVLKERDVIGSEEAQS